MIDYDCSVIERIADAETREREHHPDDLPDWISDIKSEWPKRMTLLKTRDGLYACYCADRVHGMCAFRSSEDAEALSRVLWQGYDNFTLVDVTFDEARQIAKERPPRVIALLLMDRDDVAHPLVHFVK